MTFTSRMVVRVQVSKWASVEMILAECVFLCHTYDLRIDKLRLIIATAGMVMIIRLRA